MAKLRVALLLWALPFSAVANFISAQAGPNVISHPGTGTYTVPAVQGFTTATVTESYGAMDLFADANCGGVSTCVSQGGNARFSDAITVFGTNGLLVADFTIVHFRQDEGFQQGGFALGTYLGVFSGTFCQGCASLLSTPFTAGVPIGISANGEVGATDFLPQDPQDGGGGLLLLLAWQQPGKRWRRVAQTPQR